MAQQPDMNSDLNTLVTTFVNDLQELWRQRAIEALSGVPGSSEPKRRSSSNGSASTSSNARAKGEKRSSEEMEELANVFLAYVSKNPALRIEQINKALGTKTKDLQLPIRKMISDGSLKTKGDKRSTTYFAK